jgi:UPF0755 protein
MRVRRPRLVLLVALTAWTAVVAVALLTLVSRTPAHVAEAIATTHAPASLPPSNEPIAVVIDQGASADQITSLLVRQGVLDNPARFSTLLALTGIGASLKAGRYELPAHTPAAEVLRRLQLGLTAQRLIAVPEGLRTEEIGAIFVAKGIFTQADWDAAVAKHYDEPFLADRPEGASLEGYLLPASYPVTSKTTADDVVQAMLDHFGQEVTPDLVAEAKNAGLSLYQVVTLASIVEREAAVSKDQPLIASAFLNRLNLGMALQADPTVQYAIATPDSVAKFGWWKRDLTETDLQVDSPYNTYLYPGLPPGPIANPGIDAIKAVIRAPKTDYLYFVASPACDGSHLFAATLSEHNANVQAFHAAQCGQ